MGLSFPSMPGAALSAVPVDVTDAFQSLGIALGLGLLVGIQRERAESHVAGVRTFPLITILGTISAAIGEQFGGWVIAAALAGVIAAMVLGNISESRHGKQGSGITTEIAILTMFVVGVMVWSVDIPYVVPVVVGGLVAVLLHAKKLLHDFAQRLGEKDVRAFMQFVLITFIILPVLPNEAFGPAPIDVLNPRRIWLMVVLVVGISLAGYALYKKLGQRAGTVLGGVLGGLIASTAMTVSFARRSAGAVNSTMAGALVIVLASTVVYVRMLVEIGIVAPNSFREMALPIVTIMAVGAALSLAVWGVTARSGAWLPEQENPTELKSALWFGVMFAIVLVAAAAGHHYFDERGMYAVAAISGLTGMDAINLSTAGLVEAGRLPADVGWRAAVVATIANLLFKAGIVAFLGSRRLLVMVSLMFAVLIGASCMVLWAWPDGLAIPQLPEAAPQDATAAVLK